ncbi:MAG: MFS transporter [Gammaproteobacteria bacterium]|nr:MFS transporter [Gammaproteobacteria bacterium]
MQNPTVSVLIKPITNDFGWSRSLFVSASSVGTILGGLLALIIGPAIDRYGPRWIITFGFLVMGALMILMGSINNLWQFYLLLVLSRMILQGALNLTSNVSVAKWFYRRRGIALAFPAIGQRVGAGSTPCLLNI